MAYIISITSKKDTDFLQKVKTIFDANKYQCINENTYIGNSTSQTIINQMKNLEEYKNDKLKCGIVIYHGSISTVK
ncbi:MAG: hypothetical protein KU38_02060 [Sulfurovum sp. FS08-3]|nr:MAG: hypothetical protein KU38_02060 [Sulfurovum sp. FS08-3]